MLAGGSDASNTDPLAAEPAHVILLVPGALDTSLFSTDPNWGGPYIMFASAPYEHIRMPAADLMPAAQQPVACRLAEV